MRCFTWSALSFFLALGFLFPCGVQAENKLLAKMTSKIEADPSKTYTLDKVHGPWMVMVASFHEAFAKSEEQMGKSPMEAAQALVLELRQAKIPAYIYEVKGHNESVKAEDTLGREQRMKNLRVVDAICVVAGNYPSIDAPKAQQTLKFIKQFQPKCLESGVDYVKSPGRPGPLSKAFLTSNPLLSIEELQAVQQSSDPLLVQLNNGEQFSLYENTGKYTLVIARFSGKSVNVVKESMEKAEKYFTEGDNDLDKAGHSACDLVRALRSREPLSKFEHPNFAEFAPYCRQEAYVWHDRTNSIVTVGSFESPTDPKIRKYLELFGPKSEISESGRRTSGYRYLPVKESEGVFNYIPFEPTPQLMVVPHVKN
jgi:hypothetical protein